LAEIRPKGTLRRRILSVLATAGVVLAGTGTVQADPGNSIGVCCAWNDELADGDLTYKISGGDATARQWVREATEEWDAALEGLTLTEVTGNAKPDINIKFKQGGGVIQGTALRKFDRSGFITSVNLTISGSAFGDPNNETTIEQITKHEEGHALGADHANFDGDLMSTTVSGGSSEISPCDIAAVREANHWELVDGSSTPHAPHVNHVHC
ncbi:MAG TPA: matrixin family metalloprotease, partial [Actinomycetota bacterium]|nr:matrixin family metalloprotease [Actinomycetota bacterium]